MPVFQSSLMKGVVSHSFMMLDNESDESFLSFSPKGNLRVWGPGTADLPPSIRRGSGSSLTKPAGSARPVRANSVRGVPDSRPLPGGVELRRPDTARARAGSGRGARPAGAAAGEERPPASARAPNGPGWGCEVTVAARGSWEATPSLQSREVAEGEGAPPGPLLLAAGMSRTLPLLRPRGGDHPGPRRRAQP